MRLAQVLSLVGSLVIFLSGSAWGWQGHFGGHGMHGGHGAAVNPNLLPRQAQATLMDDGRLNVKRTVNKPVYESRVKTETRTREIIVDGKVETETYTVQLPYAVVKFVSVTEEFKVMLEDASLVDLAGKAADVERVSPALKKGLPILVAARQVPGYYLSIFKPDTLLLVVDLKALTLPPPAPLPAPGPAPTALTPPGIEPAPAAARPAAGAEPMVSLAKAGNHSNSAKKGVASRRVVASQFQGSPCEKC